MSNLKTLADSIYDAYDTGKDATFLYSGTLYTLSPTGIITWLGAAGIPSGITESTAGVNRANKIQLLASNAVAASVTGTASETVLATVTIPAGIMGLNGALRVSCLWSHPGGSGNNKTLRARLGGISGTAYLSSTQTTNLSVHVTSLIIQNRNSASSQVVRSSSSTTGGSSASSVVTSSIDTSIAQDLVFTGQLANTGETITLEQYMVELILP